MVEGLIATAATATVWAGPASKHRIFGYCPQRMYNGSPPLVILFWAMEQTLLQHIDRMAAVEIDFTNQCCGLGLTKYGSRSLPLQIASLPRIQFHRCCGFQFHRRSGLIATATTGNSLDSTTG